ncbi:glucosamine-6-phosphate deaminase [Natroniella sulfidigena]|uniref:glucosamine-6-phosphate deaminase n=1 Tax=Natroniella sulfidigena TaxID=723921 RepID=UPI00200A27D7|nr:glucosamine-6-phosphate deaminase [Natroniella sulfidigena]MCK8817854.1 glucosamine-6-phosphate deaminase [Natroniella sulfidigena]
MKIIKTKDYEMMSKKAAFIVASQIGLKKDSILGLATGGTPVGMYQELIRFYQEGMIDFENVTTFNLDEYYGLSGDDEQSYRYYMEENFFKDINLKPENIHIPDGMADDVSAECDRYNQLLEAEGGIDLQVLGIGRNGHIGFNEPDTEFKVGTHFVKLDDETIEANARFFDNPEDVPQTAISMGIKNIMQAKKVVLLANGLEKADAIKKTIEGSISPQVPASVLQLHPDVTFVLDEQAASKLDS